jgi:hypothetical protein
MFTKKDYTEGRCDHRRYHGQFVTMPVYLMVKRRFTVEQLVRCPDQRHFNTIPMHEWEMLVPAVKLMVPRQLIKATNEGWSNATSVCILKEAARQIVENHWALEVA